MHWFDRIACRFYLCLQWVVALMQLSIGRSARRRCSAASMALLSLMLAIPHGSYQIQATERVGSTTSETARNEAIRAIPIGKIDSKYRSMVREIVHNATLYRRLPTCVIDCHPEMFTYVTRNPDVLVAMWRVLGISRVQLDRTGTETFRLHDLAGTKGTLQLVEHQCDDHAQNRLVMVAEAVYEGKPVHLPVKAQCLLLLRSGSVKETNGRRYVAARLDTFVRIDRASMQLFAKVIHPWVGKTADQNFSDTMQFVGNLSHTAQTHPSAIGELADRLEGVTPGRKKELMRIVRKCHQDHSQWQISRQGMHGDVAQTALFDPWKKAEE